ncbi:hypothetical protein [Streptomyces sp. NPDC059010]|uniref:hypothetical protein n=1 Tax=Streptomyces sp. NPDC059010 TaxID=3346695 RepID=UPI0036CA3B82
MARQASRTEPSPSATSSVLYPPASDQVCGASQLVLPAGRIRVERESASPVRDRQQTYREVALRLLTALAETCLTRNSARADAVVARCTRNRPSEDGVEISLPYADYYLLEGILRVLQPQDVDRAIDLSTV